MTAQEKLYLIQAAPEIREWAFNGDHQRSFFAMLSRLSKSSISFLAPDQKSLLEEANLPVGLVDRIAGQSVLVETYPEEPPATRRVEPDDFPLLIDPNGDYWNDYRPVRVLYTDEHGQV